MPRRLSANDLSLIPKFTCGDAPWEREVTDFLHKFAWDAQQRGDSTTTLFSRSDSSDVVGFISTTVVSLRTKDLKQTLGYNDWDDVDLNHIPVLHIPYFGVHLANQGRAVGTEITLRLLDALAKDDADMIHRPRFVHLHVWKANSRAVKFYKDAEFEVLGEAPAESSYFKGKTPLITMILNRYKKLG